MRLEKKPEPETQEDDGAMGPEHCPVKIVQREAHAAEGVEELECV